MTSWSRLLIVFALVLALPLKVLAGVGLGCGDGSHPMAAAMAAPEAPAPDHAGHDHAGHGGHVHGGHGHPGTSDGTGAAAPTAASAGDPQDPIASLGCSHGAPCCAAALPAAELPRMPTVHPEPQAAPFLGRLHADVVADVPDRPPRSPLA